MSELPYSDLDALALAERVRSGEISPSELVEEAIARIERANPQINAVVHHLYDEARTAARAPLPDDAPFAGVPFLVKDLLQKIRGTTTTSGSRFYAGFISDHDTELVRRYRAAGLIFVGRTNTSELGVLPVAEPEAFGPTRNPWNVEHTAGGSSGGSAAAVAAGIVPAAHGGDGGGSIRIPASCCGLFGLKPTRGRNPIGPDESEGWAGFGQEHVLSRSVRDSAALLDVTCGPEPISPYYAPPRERPYLEETEHEPGKLRIAFHTEPPLGGEVHSDCIEAVHDAARLCEELGHHVEEVPPHHPADALAQAFSLVVAANTHVDLRDAGRTMGREPSPDGFESTTWLMAQMGRRASAAELAAAIRDLQAESRRLVARYAAHDVLLTPTLAFPPPPIGALKPKGLERRVQDFIARHRLHAALAIPGVVEAASRRIFDFIPFTPVANFTGQPSMSVPLFWNAAGLPIGTMFTGRFGDEATLFRLAAQLERARPWFHQRPTVHAPP